MRPVLFFILLALMACQAEQPKTVVVSEKSQAKASPTVSNLPSTISEPSPFLQALVNRLYSIAEDQRRTVPQILLSNDSSSVASCKPRENQIILEVQALEVCRQFGADSTALLSFIIGHEMGHLFAHRSTSKSIHAFFGYYRQSQTPQADEGNADLYGLFLCKLAGLAQVKKHLPQFIEKLYHRYHFDPNLPGYPSQKERQGYTSWIGSKTDSLWQVWESGLFLMGLQQYPVATACFEYIAQYYQGAEVWHNWGTAAALAAIQLRNRQEATPYYPLLATGLFRLEAFRGPLSSGETSELNTLLNTAKRALQMAHLQRPGYLSSTLNLLMIHLLNHEFEPAEQLLALHSNKLNAAQLLFFQTLIALHRQPNGAAYSSSFEQLSHTEDPHLAFAASQNYKLLQGEALNFSMGPCPVLDFYPDQLKPTLLKIPAQHFFTLNEQYELAWKTLPHSNLVKFRTLNQSTESGLQIVHQPCPSPFSDFTGVGGNWTVTNKAQLLTDGATIDYWYALPCQPSVKCNQRHQIEAWAFLLPTGW
jgi:hypothetical protein